MLQGRWILLSSRQSWFQEFVANSPNKIKVDKYQGTNPQKASARAFANALDALFRDAILRARRKLACCGDAAYSDEDLDDDVDDEKFTLPCGSVSLQQFTARAVATLEISIGDFRLTVLNSLRPKCLLVDAATHEFISEYFPEALAAVSATKTFGKIPVAAGKQAPSQ